jgi:hypothetical protein
MPDSPKLKLVIAAALFVLAGYMTWTFLKNTKGSSETVYFYDLSAGKLFAAAKDAVPPIAGVDGPQEDAVRAVVYSVSGDCDKDQQIAYLEKYSPQLKADFEKAKANPGAEFPRLSRAQAQSHTFVRRLKDKDWTQMDTEPATQIMGEWRLAGANGTEPIICVPE